MKISFVTTNKYKFEEAQYILKDYPVELVQVNMDYAENHDEGIEKIAKEATKELANELKRPVLVDDTGLYFEAYDGFPGALPKFVYNTIGYKGIFKLLKGENRQAYFKAVVGYCQPGEEPRIFEGTMEGKISEGVYDEDKDVMPYDRIFIPQGEIETLSKLSDEKKNFISHRGKAFKVFGEWLLKQM